MVKKPLAINSEATVAQLERFWQAACEQHASRRPAAPRAVPGAAACGFTLAVGGSVANLTDRSESSKKMFGRRWQPLVWEALAVRS